MHASVPLAVPVNGHHVHLFDRYSFPAGRIAENVARALSEGAAALVFATPDHLGKVTCALENDGVDVETSLCGGQLVLRDAEGLAHALVPDGVPSKSAFDSLITASVDGVIARYGSARAYGEVVDVLARRLDFASALQLERWWNELIEGRPIEVVCGYDLAGFVEAGSVGAFHDICAEHDDVTPVPRRDVLDARHAVAALQQAMVALENEAERREAVTEHLERLQRFTSALSEAVSPFEMGQLVLGELRDAFGADAAGVFVSDGSGRLRSLGCSNIGQSQVERLRTLSEDDGLPVCAAFRSRETMWLTSREDIQSRYPEAAREAPDASTIGCVPMVLGRRRLGAIFVIYKKSREPVAWERALLEDYAKQVALAVDRAQSYEETQRARSRLQLLADASSRIAQAQLDLTKVADTLVQEVTRSGFADCCAVELRTETDAAPNIASIHRVDAERGQCVDTAVVRSKISAPLRVSRQNLGTLSALRHAGADFTKEDEQFLQDLADRAALSIENALLYQRAQQERERAEHERARAETANRAKDEFLAMLGHELRNPLSPILTAVQLMQLQSGGMLDKERTIIERQVNHMVHLVDDLLDVSRITRGKVQLKTAVVELASVVADAIEIASPLLEERSHKLVTSIPTSSIPVEADANRLAQVIANLLGNAAKYTPAGGTIRVTANVTGAKIEVSVQDDGVGIEPELLPHIFDLFVQGEQARDRAQGGLGLGLAIARNLVEMHGGMLRAESEGPGKGSVFTAELPLASGGGAAVEAADAASPAPADDCPRRVLIVDDNVDAARMLGDFLSAFGHAVCVAHDGPSALKVAAAFRPDLALLDIGLPVMDGHELGRRLASLLHDRAPKLIAITGYGHEADRRRSSEAGFHEHLVKPVDLDRLRSTISSLFIARG